MEIRKNLQRVILLYAAGVLVGCLFMNIVWRNASMFYINERKFALSLLCDDQEYGDFWECMIAIIGTFLYIIICSAGWISWGCVLVNGICFSSGIWWGAFLTECMICKGISYIITILRIIFPESICYILAYGFACCWGLTADEVKNIRRKQTGRNRNKRYVLLICGIIFWSAWLLWFVYVNHMVL